MGGAEHVCRTYVRRAVVQSTRRLLQEQQGVRTPSVSFAPHGAVPSWHVRGMRSPRGIDIEPRLALQLDRGFLVSASNLPLSR